MRSQEHLPAKFAALKSAGELERVLKEAAEQTHMLMMQLEEVGYRNHEAWKQARERYLFLPAEPEAEEPLTPVRQLMREAVVARQHASMALPDPNYQIPDPD